MPLPRPTSSPPEDHRGWPWWLAHHGPDEAAERCAFVGPWPVCRRCLAAWPLAAAVLVAGWRGRPGPPAPWEPALWLLPAALEFSVTSLGRLPYRPCRTWVSGALLGIGMGRLALLRTLPGGLAPALLTLAALGALTVPAAIYHRIVKKS